jgi:hypothetical protein
MSMEHISTYTEEKSKQLSKGPKFVRWAVMIGIVIVLNVFFMVMRGLVFQEPNYTDFCPNPPMPVAASIGETSSNYDTTACSAAYTKAENQYQLDGFIMLIGLGVLAIIIGVIPLGSSIVSTGLSYGGVLAFIIASGQYWTDAGNWLRFAISLIALIVLVYIGFKRFKD